MNRYIFLILFFVFLSPLTANAQCENPHAEMGVLIMNKKHKVMQYCNGEVWVGLWGGGGSLGSSERVSGEVVAFDLAACPDGWSEYLPARGRFIRGIDNGASNDPDGVRAVGHLQTDAFQGFKLGSPLRPEFSYMKMMNERFGSGAYSNYSTLFLSRDNSNTASAGGMSSVTLVDDGVNGSPRITNETRPKNVALLYCRKN